MASKLRWGILSTGRIAKTFAKGLANSKSGTLVACGSRTKEAAEAFGKEFNVPHCHASYEALLADADVEAVYIAPPHPMHAEWAIKAAEAKKHILCEKPLALNLAEAMAIVEAARRHDVFLMEAFMYRCHPQTAKLVELLREKAIGQVRMIQASFAFDARFDPKGRLWSNELAGGGILDVGCYAVSMARLIAGVAAGMDFAEPVEVGSTGVLNATTRVDEYTAAVLKFPGDILAQVATGVRVTLENSVRVFGSEGQIFVPAPWIPARDGGNTKIFVQRKGDSAPKELTIESPAGLYTLEADTVAANIEKRQAPPPAMTWDDTLGNMRVMDTWRKSIGLTYDAEKPESGLPTVDRRPLAPRAGHNMKYARIEGVSKPVSRMVMGSMMEGAVLQAPHAFVLYDEFFRCGGNAIDTAYVYGGGNSERVLGQWVKARGIREKLVILGKGAHTPHCNPKALTQQLKESLDRLQTDYLDIYMMHRDNPEIPVAEFVDVLNEHHAAGRIHVFGGSNWPIARIEEANAYAKKKGLAGFSAVSNNFSLARMVDPVWTGCVAASDPESRAWFAKTRMPLLPWSSQARGFFTDRARPENKSDAELVRCWYSKDNFTRKERVLEMSKKRGVLPINVALAYVLCQPFPTFGLIGPRALSELITSLPALDIELTPKDLRWLNLEE